MRPKWIRQVSNLFVLVAIICTLNYQLIIFSGVIIICVIIAILVSKGVPGVRRRRKREHQHRGAWKRHEEARRKPNWGRTSGVVVIIIIVIAIIINIRIMGKKICRTWSISLTRTAMVWLSLQSSSAWWHQRCRKMRSVTLSSSS